MKYCIRCLMPDTKPYLNFDEEGVCDACRSNESKHAIGQGIDWDGRAAAFDQVVKAARAKRAPFYDVVIPVSGGKDSISQVHRVLPYDLRILAVNVDYGIKTDVGRRNLECIPEMGAHLLTYRPEMGLHKKLIRIGLEDFGDPDLLSHTLLHGYPLRVALQFKVPLIVLGENSAFEYGGDADIASARQMTTEWFDRYAANEGHNAQFISDKYCIPYEKLKYYEFPSELDESDTEAVFLSYFCKWDSEENLRIALTHGFQTLPEASEGTYRNYVGIDEKINRIHQYLKVLKFGYGRATDHACEDIRNGRMTREEAKELVRERDLMELSDYFVNDVVEFLDMPREVFLATLERYRNSSIWQRDDSGKWFIPGHLQDA